MKVSISRIKLFKGCRRAYELKYIEDIHPNQTPDALTVGRTYHKMIEEWYKVGAVETEHTKEHAMFMAYLKYIAPHFIVSESEKELTYDLGDGDTLIGYADGIAKDGCLVEHKTTGQEISEAYEYDLQWDEQILAYMLMTGARKIYYTVIRKPTIRQKQKETDEEFYTRVCDWYDEHTEKKIRVLTLTRTDEEVAEFEKSLRAMVKEMKQTDNLYRNQGWCYKWGRRCEYAPICLHYDPNQEYIDFHKGGATDNGSEPKFF